MEKYNSRIYYAVCECNDWVDNIITRQKIDNMNVQTVLEYYLQWEGIFGYTNDILKICGISKY